METAHAVNVIFLTVCGGNDSLNPRLIRERPPAEHEHELIPFFSFALLAVTDSVDQQPVGRVCQPVTTSTGDE